MVVNNVSSSIRLLLLGKPCSGKGTQSNRLARKFDIPIVSTGDLIRLAISKKTSLGVKFKSYLDKGLLVPDELILDIISYRLEEEDCKKGFILDGFPRTIQQAISLEKWLDIKNTPLSIAINIDVPDHIIMQRFEGRFFCPQDNTSYHIKFAPPKKDNFCDVCHSELEKRSDDEAKLVKSRIEEYNIKTKPLLDFYTKRDLFKEISGIGALDEIENRIASVITCFLHA